MDDVLNTLPLAALHAELGGRMVPFAGWSMPVQYPLGVMQEHLHTRAAAGLFDVSHMGQIVLRPRGTVEELCLALERLVPVDVLGLAPGRQRYGMFTTDEGGILDDLMIARFPEHLVVVVNAGNKAAGIAHLRAQLPEAEVEVQDDRCLLALQGPGAVGALAPLAPAVAAMRFMDAGLVDSRHGPLRVTRSGYTGEDGYEVSVSLHQGEGLARALLSQPGVQPIGLGARDSLRLEAGLPLHGHDLDQSTSPVEAGLSWAIQKVRRAGGARAGGFPGADRILAELAAGPARRLTALRPDGRAPMREGTALFDGDQAVGTICSGSFGPSVGAPIALAYLPAALAAPGTALTGEVRGRRLPLVTATLPFHPHSYKR